MLRASLVRRAGPALTASAALLFGPLGAPSPARATVVKAMTLEEKTTASPVVLYGLVERVESDWEVPGVMIQTLVTVKVLESIKGDHARGERVLVRPGGGRVGDVEQTAPGLSTFEPGEEVVLFLEPLGEVLVPIGIGIGKYGVRIDGGTRWVTHDPRVAALRTDGPRPVVEDLEAMEPEPLPAFLKRVRSHARGISTDAGPGSPKYMRLKPPPALPGR
jgi:hypothetical protein